MTTKMFINDVATYVPEVLNGIALANPDTLTYDPEHNLIARADSPHPGKVSIVQGSGSGHEPAHVLLVGRGLLDAAVPGDVFSAPPVDYVQAAIKRVASDAGVLLIVNNYTGDRMAFEMAEELARADGIEVATIFVDDDVSVEDSTFTVGRRGVAGNYFVIKAVGAAAEKGAGLPELVRIGTKVNAVTRTMGIGLTAPTPPAKGEPLFDLPQDEIEVGIGIHGEPGRHRRKMAPADELVREILDPVVADLPFSGGDEVAIQVNGLGGTPISELYLVFGSAHQYLSERNIAIRKSYIGSYTTSLNSAGASITLVKLDDEIDSLLSEPAESALHIF